MNIQQTARMEHKRAHWIQFQRENTMTTRVQNLTRNMLQLLENTIPKTYTGKKKISSVACWNEECKKGSKEYEGKVQKTLTRPKKLN